MSSVFRKGDVVYYAAYPNTPLIVKNTDRFLAESVDKQLIVGNLVLHKLLSFTPWPAPCHERPFTEVGWWIRQDCSGCYDVLWRANETEYGVAPNKPRLKNWPGTAWVKFLGKEIE